MKKWIASLLVCSLAAAAGVYWFEHRGSHPRLDGAALLASDTDLLIQINDAQRTISRWPETSLAKILAEPEVQAFLSKPMAGLLKEQKISSRLDILEHAKPGAGFLAAALNPEGNPVVSGGMELDGDPAAVEALMAEVRTMMDAAAPGGKRDLTKHGAVEIETFTSPHWTCAWCIQRGSWFFASEPDALFALLDAAGGKPPAKTLRDEPTFHAGLQQMPADSDLLVHFRPDAMITRLASLLAVSGENLAAEQLGALKQFHGATAAIKLDGAAMRDVVFLAVPGTDRQPLSHRTLAMASGEAMLNHIGRLDLPDAIPLPDPSIDRTGTLQMLSQLGLIFSANGVSMKDVRTAFGPEYSVMADWPEADLQPRMVVALEVRDQAQAAAIYQLLGRAAGTPLTSHQTAGGVEIQSMPGTAITGIEPAMSLTKDFMFMGLHPADIEAALAKPDGLEKLPAYLQAMAETKPATDMAGYLDLRRAWERTYGVVRPLAVLFAALAPGLSDTVDLSKLPETNTVGQHLQPLVYSQTTGPEGIRMESSGTISLNQIGMLLIGTAATASVQTISELAALSAAAVPAPTALPAATPAPSSGP